VIRYLRALEVALIRSVAEFGVRARRIPGLTGVWAGARKLAAIGVRVSAGWITSHGFALNVTTDPSDFRWIVPCGIRHREVTSLADLTGRYLSTEDVALSVAPIVAETLGLRHG
jgi:lipoyl(octanoyl) transferase